MIVDFAPADDAGFDDGAWYPPCDPWADPDCRYCAGTGEIWQSHGEGRSEHLCCSCVAMPEPDPQVVAYVGALIRMARAFRDPDFRVRLRAIGAIGPMLASVVGRVG
jgi:hypothetical protein